MTDQIDRGDIAQILAEVKHERASVFDGTDRIVALMRRDVAITLTPEEAHLLASAARHEARWNHENAKPEERMGGEAVYYEAERQYLTLAARLEAAS